MRTPAFIRHCGSARPAAAAPVVEQIQAARQFPVWSTGEPTLASLQVAQKLGFEEVTRRTYVIVPADA